MPSPLVSLIPKLVYEAQVIHVVPEFYGNNPLSLSLTPCLLSCLDILLAGLRLFAKHAVQFSSCLMDHYRTVFEVMSKLCGHINVDMKKTSYYALESFLKQVSYQHKT